jgi:hypothetical protein
VCLYLANTTSLPTTQESVPCSTVLIEGGARVSPERLIEIVGGHKTVGITSVGRVTSSCDNLASAGSIYDKPPPAGLYPQLADMEVPRTNSTQPPETEWPGNFRGGTSLYTQDPSTLTHRACLEDGISLHSDPGHQQGYSEDPGLGRKYASSDGRAHVTVENLPLTGSRSREHTDSVEESVVPERVRSLLSPSDGSEIDAVGFIKSTESVLFSIPSLLDPFYDSDVHAVGSIESTESALLNLRQGDGRFRLLTQAANLATGSIERRESWGNHRMERYISVALGIERPMWWGDSAEESKLEDSSSVYSSSRSSWEISTEESSVAIKMMLEKVSKG